MATISAVLIVKNEGERLQRTLDSLDFVDEVIVVDSGSDDDTLAIAQAHGARCFVYADWQGFGLQRQRAQAQARSEWVFAIDADEVVTPQLRAALLQAVAKNKHNTVYRCTRLSHCFGRFIRHGGWYPDYVTRLYRRSETGYNDALVHESVLEKDLTVKTLKGDLLHYPYRDLHHYLVKSAGYGVDWASMHPTHRGSIARGVWHGIGCFVRMYILRAGFLDGKSGFLLALLSMYSTCIKYAILWERRRTGKNNFLSD